MIKRLKALWADASGSPAESRQHDVSLAVAALMTEVMRMDDRLDKTERDKIVEKLRQRFNLGSDETDRLIKQAEQQVSSSLDLHQFTSVVVKSFTTEQRVHILAELWQVAMADGHVDPYEEQLIRRIAELIGLHHSQFIEAKISAGKSLDATTPPR